jgi:hypothetical protein
VTPEELVQIERRLDQRSIDIADVHGLAAALRDAWARIDTLERDGSPGVMHAVDQAFYDLTVKQRDSAWADLANRTDKQIAERCDMAAEIRAAKADAEQAWRRIAALLDQWEDICEDHPSYYEWSFAEMMKDASKAFTARQEGQS